MSEDTRIVPWPAYMPEEQTEALDTHGIKNVKWGNTSFAEGPGLAPNFFNDIAKRRRNKESIVIFVTARAGKGKSWFALRAGEILDPKFDVNTQVCFRREEIMLLLSGDSPIRSGQVMIIDEAHFGIGARHWTDRDQQDISDHIAAARSKGYILFIVVLHQDMIDKQIREYVMDYLIKLESRGRAVAYFREDTTFDRKKYPTRIGSIFLKIPGFEACPNTDCLGCSNLSRCKVMRAVYERKKRAFTDEKVRVITEKEEEAKARRIPKNEELMELLAANDKKIGRTNRGNAESVDIQDILRENGYRVSDKNSERIAKRYTKFRDTEVVETGVGQ